MSEVSFVPLSRIKLNEYNPNSMDASTFRGLLTDMKEGGSEAVDPVLLRPLEEGYEVVDGEHRVRAARRLGWTEIRARVQDLSLEEAMLVNFRKNVERGRLDPVKEGRLYRQVWCRSKPCLPEDEECRDCGGEGPLDPERSETYI